MRRSLSRLAVAGLILVAGAIAGGKLALTTASGGTSHPTEVVPPPLDLHAACQRQADWLRRQLRGTFQMLVHAPFVLAGDLPRDDLERQYRQVIEPAAEAMGRAYFATRPNEPITVLVSADEASYCAQTAILFGEVPNSSAGFYRQHLRMIVVNAPRGPAALRHELTHALMDFDFPSAPPWLSEGLASLHEDVSIDPSRSRLAGEPGPRLATLIAAYRDGSASNLAALLTAGDFNGSNEAVDYAMARHFCRFLQAEGVLEEVYRRHRQEGPASRDSVRSGEELAAVTHRTLAAIETRFWDFVVAQDANSNVQGDAGG